MTEIRCMDSEDYTREQAQAKFYPALRPEDIDIYHVAVSTAADWHSDAESYYLWLPTDDLFRLAILAQEFPPPSFRVIAAELEDRY